MRALSSEVLIEEDALRARIAELGRAIAEDTPEDGEIAVLIVLKGAFVFAADLLRAIPRRTRVGFLETHKDPDDPSATDFVFTHAFPLEGADLLIVEDILDSGITMNRLFDRLRARKPSRMRTAVLLDKSSRRVEEVAIDYTGFEIPDKWVVGFGLDDEEAHRNLPHIGYTEEVGE